MMCADVVLCGFVCCLLLVAGVYVLRLVWWCGLVVCWHCSWCVCSDVWCYLCLVLWGGLCCCC